MSAAAVELLTKLAVNRPVTTALVADVDTVELAILVLSFVSWPAHPGAARILREPPSVTDDPSPTTAGTPAVVGSVPPGAFLSAVAHGDERVVDLAPDVSAVALALVGLVALEQPAQPDVAVWADRWAMAERVAALGTCDRPAGGAW